MMGGKISNATTTKRGPRQRPLVGERLMGDGGRGEDTREGERASSPVLEDGSRRLFLLLVVLCF
jgi:hypothetical protein